MEFSCRVGGCCVIGLALLLMPVFALAQTTKTKSRKPASPLARRVMEAEKFITEVEQRLAELAEKAERADWVNNNFITDDTELIAADARKEYIAAYTKAVEAARAFDGLKLPPVVARKFQLLKRSLTLPAPSNPAEREELTRLATSMQSAYGKGKYCPQGPDGPCLSLGDLEQIMANSRDPEKLKEAWLGWHAVSPPYRADYVRFVELANKGAREMGYQDLGALWRSNYDMPPDAFAAEMERLWQQVRPLYESLYIYTRAKLSEYYGRQLVPENGPMPAHLLGNMWSQQWDNIYPLLKPATSDPGYDLSDILKQKQIDAKQMVRIGEGFFTSLGFDPLPSTFWERSLFTKPRDREVVCHASAWHIDGKSDVRLKMCINQTAEDFATIHHELGHTFYQLAYAHQPRLFQDSANDGFHEALGDTIALSVTPDYLKKIGLIETVPDESADIGLLLQRALDKVAFLPFGYLVDQWRWNVFSGKTSPNEYNKAWWDLRMKYQGIAPPVPRTEADFDAGAKYHVPANTPYARYFLATILQFQFHRALCQVAGYTGPLHRCSIYGNKQAGAKLKAMMAMGQSRPWPEALKALTGSEQMDATAILDYFAPLKKWLDEQNQRLAPAATMPTITDP
ncbi:MAG: M2 family metallopeptidase [Acidobacteriota bacterium]|nr:M2 family metallopeptidase [Blastocatellia bacterium]MDW8238401.1 M2 family metallopeptidase [Acidobacteriota bacterium]